MYKFFISDITTTILSWSQVICVNRLTMQKSEKIVQKLNVSFFRQMMVVSVSAQKFYNWLSKKVWKCSNIPLTCTFLEINSIALWLNQRQSLIRVLVMLGVRMGLWPHCCCFVLVWFGAQRKFNPSTTTTVLPSTTNKVPK